MTDEAVPSARVCGNGHTNPEGWAVCGVCGTFPRPGTGALAPLPAVAAPAAPSEPLGVAMYQEANKFRGYASIFTILTALGAIGIGYVSAQETTCDLLGTFPSCESTTDGATFAIVAASAFVGGMLFVLPLRALASILTGVARLLESRAVDALTAEDKVDSSRTTVTGADLRSEADHGSTARRRRSWDI